MDIVLSIFFAFLAFRIALDIHWGGNEWKQGDWLINSQMIDVRRSATGDVAIFLSDLLGMNPVVLVAVVQIILLAVLFVLLRNLVRSLDPSLALLLVFSPALFTVFWVADPQGSVRKELLAFIGFLMVAEGIVRQRDLLFAVGAVVIALSVFAHEALVLFLPLLGALLLVSWPRKEGRVLRIFASLGAGVVSGFAVLYALSYTQVSDVALICEPLLERGANEKVCTGAISWLANDLGFAYNRLLGYLTVRKVGGFAVGYGAALALLFYVIFLLSHRSRLIFLLALTILPFLPLFFIAVDWGRWVSYHVFSITLLIVVMLQTGQLRVLRQPPLTMVVILVLGALTIAPSHTIGLDQRGAIGEIVTTFIWLFQG